MSLAVKYIGQDIQRKAVLKKADGTAYNLDTEVDDILVAVCVNNVKQFEFDLAGSGGREALVKTDAANGEFAMNFQRDKTLNFPEGKLSIEVLHKLTVSGFSSGYHSIGVFDLYEIRSSKTTGY